MSGAINLIKHLEKDYDHDYEDGHSWCGLSCCKNMATKPHAVTCLDCLRDAMDFGRDCETQLLKVTNAYTAGNTVFREGGPVGGTSAQTNGTTGAGGI